MRRMSVLVAGAALAALPACGSDSGGLDRKRFDTALERVYEECGQRNRKWIRIADASKDPFRPPPDLKDPLSPRFAPALGFMIEQLRAHGGTDLGGQRGTVTASMERVLSLRLTGDRCGGGESRPQARRLASALPGWGAAVERIDRECRARERALRLRQYRARQGRTRFPQELGRPPSPKLERDVEYLIDHADERDDPLAQAGPLPLTLRISCGDGAREKQLGEQLTGAFEAAG